MKKKAILLTLGEPTGIGPEVAGKALRKFHRVYPSIEVVVLGESDSGVPGRPTRKSARAALMALERSAEMALDGKASAIVNAPVSKEWLQKVGFAYPGQTEFYAHAFGMKDDEVTMTMTSPVMTVGLVSTHCSLASARRKVTEKRIINTAIRLDALLRALGIRQPRLAVAGLNPHAGENGAFGEEENRIIQPAVEQLKRKFKRRVSGPVSPDAVFIACRKGQYDGVVSMYHDQGLIPFKLVSFESGVNVTAGLPVWRMSPDHGTALDIAGKGVADAGSMYSALELAARLSGETS